MSVKKSQSQVVVPERIASKGVLNHEVLCLNRNWMVIGTRPTRQAIQDLAADAATALFFDSAGNPTPYKWLPWRDEDGIWHTGWIDLEPRPNIDDVIHTPRRAIVAPRVIIMVNFSRVIVKRPKLTMRNLRIRDQDTCQYTGKKLRPTEMSREHVEPVSCGGKTTWTNVVLVHRDVNSKRGNMPLDKAGLRLMRQPVAPRGRQPAEMITPVYPEWEMFLRQRSN
jgi:5-methylcytosine-specific restriction endonuclease McrA